MSISISCFRLVFNGSATIRCLVEAREDGECSSGVWSLHRAHFLLDLTADGGELPSRLGHEIYLSLLLFGRIWLPMNNHFAYHVINLSHEMLR